MHYFSNVVCVNLQLITRPEAVCGHQGWEYFSSEAYHLLQEVAMVQGTILNHLLTAFRWMELMEE